MKVVYKNKLIGNHNYSLANSSVLILMNIEFSYAFPKTY